MLPVFAAASQGSQSSSLLWLVYLPFVLWTLLTFSGAQFGKWQLIFAGAIVLAGWGFVLTVFGVGFCLMLFSLVQTGAAFWVREDRQKEAAGQVGEAHDGHEHPPSA